MILYSIIRQSSRGLQNELNHYQYLINNRKCRKIYSIFKDLIEAIKMSGVQINQI